MNDDMSHALIAGPRAKVNVVRARKVSAALRGCGGRSCAGTIKGGGGNQSETNELCALFSQTNKRADF